MIIYKYPLRTVTTKLELPRRATILTVQCQHGEIVLWALVDPEQPTETRVIRAIGTGQEYHFDNQRYVATVQMDNGHIVLHFFEEAPR